MSDLLHLRMFPVKVAVVARHCRDNRRLNSVGDLVVLLAADILVVVEVDGVEHGQMLGELWCNSRFEADMLGSPLRGNGSIGFDPVKEKYVGTWKDSATPFLYTFEGDFDADANVLEMSGVNFDPVRRCPATYRSRLEFTSADQHVLELSIDVPDGARGASRIGELS